MGFVCTTTGKEFEIADDTVLMPIGYDDQEPKSYTLIIGFDSMAGGDPEFYFCILEVNTEEHTELRHWSGLDVAKFTSKDDRRLIS